MTANDSNNNEKKSIEQILFIENVNRVHFTMQIKAHFGNCNRFCRRCLHLAKVKIYLTDDLEALDCASTPSFCFSWQNGNA